VAIELLVMTVCIAALIAVNFGADRLRLDSNLENCLFVDHCGLGAQLLIGLLVQEQVGHWPLLRIPVARQ